MVACAVKVESEFSDAQDKFENIIGWLSGKESHKQTHSEVETQLEKEGRELLRLLYQSHLDARGLVDIGTRLESHDGTIRTNRRVTHCNLKTLFGGVVVNRLSYGADGVESLHPKDAQLNLPVDVHSHSVRKIAAREAARSSFEEAVSTIDEYTGIHVAKQQVEGLVEKSAVDFDEFYETRKIESPDPAKPSGPILVLTSDSKGIVVRKEDLREATRKAAEKGEKKLQKRLSKGEKRNRKRMATVVSVYTTEHFERTPEQIAGEFGSVREVEKGKRPKPESKRVWASIEKSKEEVVDEMYREAEKRDPDRQKQVVAVVDGEEKQLDLIKEGAKEHGFNMKYILDIIHVLGYLWKAAYVFFKEGEREAEVWVSERLLLILKGKSRHVAEDIRKMMANLEIPVAARKAADKCADYLLKYEYMMRYDEYLAAGFPIASGVIEGACRYLVKDRMDRTGARWSIAGAESVLKMRALLVSGDFKDYWDFHTKQEYRRNYDPMLRQAVEEHKLFGDNNKYGHLRVVK